MRFEHYADQPLELDRTRTYDQTERGNGKPRGLWVSVPGEDDWPHWVAENEFRTEYYVVKHEVVFAKDANILFLETIAAIREFAEKYKSTDGDAWNTYFARIDWDRVAKDYDGIVIAPYRYWELRWDIAEPDNFFWYSGWDVASGVVWNLNSIEEVRLVGVISHATP